MNQNINNKSLDSMLRVDHAGEVAARKIYDGQLLILGNRPEAKEIKKMRDQEQEHLDAFDDLLNEYKVRPSLLTPVWNSAGFALGAFTALMGSKAAMACTIAVEEVIGEHYEKQSKSLKKSNLKLSKKLDTFAEEELEHRDIAKEHDGEMALGYKLIRKVIQTGCRCAIKIVEKV